MPHVKILLRSLKLVILVLMIETSWASSTIRNFTPRFQTNAPGNILIVGNTLMSCQTSTNCNNARNGTGITNNNSWNMRRLDIDPAAPGTGSANTSTSADLTIPAGSNVLWAGVYWGAQSNSGSRNQASIRTPASGTYQAITANQMDTNGSNYHAFADITALVQVGGNGTYFMGGISVNQGGGRYGGWSIVVAYSNPAEQFKNLTIFDGYAVVNTQNPRDINIGINGFLTPAFGTVGAEVGFVAYEGDLGITGDQVLFEGSQLGNATNPATNSPNSSISQLGTTFTAKNPNYLNQLGYDADTFSANGILANNATNATLQMRTTGDWYYPGVITTAIDIFVPEFNAASYKTVEDINGGEVRPGDTLEYIIGIQNTGNDGAVDVVITDPIPTSTTYVPNSIEYLTSTTTGFKTDTAADDEAEFDAINNEVIARIGAGANATTGGALAPGEGVAFKFRVTIDDPITVGSITNTAQVDYVAQTLNIPLSETATTSAVLNIESLPAFSNKKTFAIISDPVNNTTNPKSIPGSIGQYTIEIENQGTGTADTDTISVIDTIPQNFELFTGNVAAGKPYDFIDGSISSSLSCDFISLGDFSDCVDFSNDDRATWNYVPNGSFDSGVTDIRFVPLGKMTKDDGAAPFPSFELHFQVRQQ